MYLLRQRNQFRWGRKGDQRSHRQLEPETGPGRAATEGMPVDIPTTQGFTRLWCLGETDTEA